MSSLVLPLLLLASAAWAGPSMDSSSSHMTRDVVNGGGAAASSANGSLVGSAAEEVTVINAASATGKLKAGWSELHAFPGAVSGFTAALDASESSATLNWVAPGYDGSLGAIQTGSSYFVRVASYTAPDSFNYYSANFTISTSAPVSPAVGTGVTGLIPNTTDYAQVWLLDADGNLSPPAVNRATFTTLALPPIAGALEFLSIQRTTVTVAWNAFPASPPDASSKTSEGYVLEASSNNFGALAPPGAPIFSSVTYNVLNSTLTLGPGVAGDDLDLANTYYFRIGSYNHESRANYTYLPRLNFQIQQSTGLISLGAINPTVTRSSVSTSSMVVVNVGNWPVTLELAANMATVPTSPWSLSTVTGNETATLMSTIKSGVVEPLPTAFSTNLTPTFRACQVGGNYAGAVQDCVQIPAGQARTFWFKFTMPDSSVSLGPETMRVMTTPTYP